MNRNEELRKLPAASLHGIADILETNKDWQVVMSLIPRDPKSDNFEPKYNYEHIRLIEEHARNTNRRCADVLFDEWGTSGRIRPTLGTLMEILLKAEQYRAADLIAIMLHEELPKRPKRGPAAKIEPNITDILFSGRLHSTNIVKSDNLKSKSTNGTFNHVIHNGSTKQVEYVGCNSYNFIQIPTNDQSSFIPIIKALQTNGQQSTAQIPSATGDPDKLTESQFIPDFNQISPKSHGVEDQTMSTPSISETSENHSETIDQTTSSDHFQTENVPQILSKNLFSSIDSGILKDVNLIQFPYRDLEEITNKFSEHLIESTGGLSGKIGSGGFGDVYAGFHAIHGILAVKKIRNALHLDSPELTIKFFNSEVNSLSQLRHYNIVPILGFSLDGPAPCIVCKYIEGGSLEQKIEKKILNESERINIILGTAEGLKYIHNSVKPRETGNASTDEQHSTKKNYYIHGDVKSANILLTQDCVPKLCDFGLSKKCDRTFVTKSVMGTTAYMAPESFTGTITQKSDIFSFGVVLLELLTGRKPIIVDNMETINIIDYVEDYCIDNDISNLLDPVVEKWTKAAIIYQLAKHCLQRNKNDRPTMNDVCDVLYKLDH